MKKMSSAHIVLEMIQSKTIQSPYLLSWGQEVMLPFRKSLLPSEGKPVEIL